MANTATPSPESISDSEFQALLEAYPACIAVISDTKGGMSNPKQVPLAGGFVHGANGSDTLLPQPNPARNRWPVWISFAMGRLSTPLVPGTLTWQWV